MARKKNRRGADTAKQPEWNRRQIVARAWSRVWRRRYKLWILIGAVLAVLLLLRSRGIAPFFPPASQGTEPEQAAAIGNPPLIRIAFAVFITWLRFLLQHLLVIAKIRYNMARRDASVKESFRHTLELLEWKYFRHLAPTVMIYKLIMTCWQLTIIGGFYKLYQYRFVPQLLAEHPDLRWREARTISTRLTAGWKVRMFLMDLSCFYLFLLKCVPVIGLLVMVPFESAYLTEQYRLRRQALAAEGKADGVVPEEKG